MKKNIAKILVVGIVTLLMITSCSNVTKSEPTPTTEPIPTVTETEQTSTKSDTQQIIDNVLAYIEAESVHSGQSGYWNNGFDVYGKFKWGENYPESPNYQHDGYHITRLLSMCKNSDYPTKTGYDFPEIQENLAMFDIFFTLDYGFAEVKNVFRFNLINNNGWKITDLRLIYTDSPSFKQYVY